MKIKITLFTILLTTVFTRCTKEYNCSNGEISTSFINFIPSDIDTFIIKKYKQKDNFQNLIDSLKIVKGSTGTYAVSNDTTSVLVGDELHGIRAGFDWIIFIPAKNKSIVISEIDAENKTEKCGSGIFSMDKQGCLCRNEVFSLKKDNQKIPFPNNPYLTNTIYIRN